MPVSSQIPGGLLVYGYVCIDIHLHASLRAGQVQDSLVERIQYECGGSAANCAAAAVRLARLAPDLSSPSHHPYSALNAS